MRKKDVINYMVTCEGYMQFFIDNMKDVKAIELEWDLITDELYKDGKITSEQFNNWKRPSFKQIKKLLGL